MSEPANRPVQDLTTWIVALGVLLILLGFGAIAVSFLMPGAVRLSLAWVFLIGGLIRIVHAFQSRPSQGFWLKLSAGILYEVASLLLFTKLMPPDISLLMQPGISLSALLGVIILIAGLLEVAMGSQLKAGSYRNWVLISGLLSGSLGVLFITNLKLVTAWLLGLLVGASLIATGLWFIILSLGFEDAVSQEGQPSLTKLAQLQMKEKLLRLKFWRKSSHKEAQ